MAGELKYVLREMEPAAREFYRRLGQGELATTYCHGCRQFGFPPRLRCADCGSAVQWRALSGRGRVYAFTQQERGLRFLAPDVIGIVELEEGVRVLGALDAAFEQLTVGQAVEACVLEGPDLKLLSFRPRGSLDTG